MKTIRIFSLTVLMAALVNGSFAQTKTETLKVSGECGMCKKKIEKAAKEAGATYALWNMDTKVLTVKYSSATTNTAKIERKIAGVGYDTRDFKATEEAYNKLEECCQYERESITKDETNTKMDCCKKKGDSKTAMKCSDDKAGCGSKKTQQ